MFDCASDCEEERRFGPRVRAARGCSLGRTGPALRIVSRDSLLPLFRVDDGIVEEIGIRVIPVEFENLRDEPSSWPALDVNQYFERIACIGLYGFIRKLDATLQNTTREPRKSLFRGIRMDRGKGSRVTCV